MTRMTLSKIAALMDCVPGFAVAQPIEKKGTTPYVTHIFRPLMSIDVPGLVRPPIWRRSVPPKT